MEVITADPEMPGDSAQGESMFTEQTTEPAKSRKSAASIQDKFANSVRPMEQGEWVHFIKQHS